VRGKHGGFRPGVNGGSRGRGRAFRPLAAHASLILIGACLSIAAALPCPALASKIVYESFGSQGTLGGQFQTPRGIAVNSSGVGPADPGEIYVVDEGSNRIERFRTIGLGEVEFVSAWGADVIQAGKANDIAGTNPFEVCTVAVDCKTGAASGGNFGLDGNGALAKPQYIALDGDTGNVYVSDRDNRRIDEYDGVGNFIRSFGWDVVEGGAAGTGSLTATSKTVSALKATSKAFVVGQAITGTGIPSGTTVTAVTTGAAATLTLSQAAEASGAAVPLQVAESTGNVPVNEVQTVTLGANTTGGTFALTIPARQGFAAEAATLIPFNASPNVGAESVQSKLEAKGGMAGRVTVTSPNPGGGTLPGGPYTIEFTGSLGDTNLGQLTAASAGLIVPIGEAKSVTVATSNQGTAFEVCTASIVCKIGATSGTGTATRGPAGTLGNNEEPKTFGIAVSPADGNPVTGTVALANTGMLGIATYNLDGSSPTVSGSALDFSINTPRAVAVDSRGIIYAGTLSSGQGVLRRYDSLNSNGGGVGFLAPIAAPPLIGTGELTAGLAIDGDADGAGPEEDLLYALRQNATAAALTVVQQFGPMNDPGLGAPPTAVDVEHGEDGTLKAVNGLGIDEASGHLYISESASGHRVWILVDPPDDPPLATTGESDPGFDGTLRHLNGVVNPNGFKVNGCRFEYGLTAGYGESTSCDQTLTSLGKGTTGASVDAETEPLEYEATYHYRLVASNIGAVGFGEDRIFVTGSPASEGCPNEAIRLAQGVRTLLLPDCMALELTSPGKKGNSVVLGPELSATGDRLLYQGKNALTEDAPVYEPLRGARYVASRNPTSESWQTEATLPSEPAFAGSWERSRGGAGFSPDLSHWFTILSTGSQAQQGIGQGYEGSAGGVLSPISPLLIPQNQDPPSLGNYFFSITLASFEGASSDLSRFFFAPERGATLNVGYLAGDPTSTDSNAGANTYVAGLDSAGDPSLELLSRDAADKVWGGNCGSSIGGPQSKPHTQGAISFDGSRVYFSARAAQPAAGDCSVANTFRILERVETPTGPAIAELIASECARVAPSCSSADGSDFFQGASVDGSKVFFTTNRQLADSDLDGSAAECNPASPVAVAGCDLYLYDSGEPAGHRLIQVSAGETVGGHETGKEARVLDGVTGISGDGSHVYFVAEGVLTGPNDEGNSPTTESGSRNLYLYERDEANPSGRLAFVGTLAGTDVSGLWGGPGSFQNGAAPVPIKGQALDGTEIGGDGHALLFLSKASLTADDSDGGFRDVFRYDAEAEELQRISKAAAGGSDNGMFDVQERGVEFPLGPDFAENGRWASERGDTVVFSTAEALVPGDRNEAADFYFWRDGKLFRLPGLSPRDFNGNVAPTQDIVLSSDGASVAFTTPSPLLPDDGDSANSIYVARIGGGFAPPAPPHDCIGEECQEPFAAQSNEEAAASEGVVSGNPPWPKVKPKPCKRGYVRKHGRCIKRHRRHRKPSRRSVHRRDANTNGRLEP
jgi:hypothetical protein